MRRWSSLAMSAQPNKCNNAMNAIFLFFKQHQHWTRNLKNWPTWKKRTENRSMQNWLLRQKKCHTSLVLPVSRTLHLHFKRNVTLGNSSLSSLPSPPFLFPSFICPLSNVICSLFSSKFLCAVLQSRNSNSSHILTSIDASNGQSEGRQGKLKHKAVRIQWRDPRCVSCDTNKRLFCINEKHDYILKYIYYIVAPNESPPCKKKALDALFGNSFNQRERKSTSETARAEVIRYRAKDALPLTEN